MIYTLSPETDMTTWRSLVHLPLLVGGGDIGLKSSSAVAKTTEFYKMRPRGETEHMRIHA